MATRQDKYVELLGSVSAPKAIKQMLKKEVESPQFALQSLAHFKELDVDGNHVLDRSELKRAFKELMEDAGREASITRMDIDRLMAEFDEDRSGSISFTEYLELAQYCYVSIGLDNSAKVVDLLSTRRRAGVAAERTEKLIADSSLSEDAKVALSETVNAAAFRKEHAAEFKRLDADGNGRLDHAELSMALARVGRTVSLTLTKHSVDMALADYDADGNGFLGIGEYIELAKFIFVNKETGSSGIVARYGADASSDRNTALAQKAFDTLAAVLSKKEEVRVKEKTELITLGTVTFLAIGVGLGFLFASRRR